MNKILIAIIALAALTGCTRADEARRVLAGAGYTNIETGGYAFFGCSEDDTFHTKFKARGQNGQQVEGVVCSGVLKGATIRLD